MSPRLHPPLQRQAALILGQAELAPIERFPTPLRMAIGLFEFDFFVQRVVAEIFPPALLPRKMRIPWMMSDHLAGKVYDVQHTET